MVRFILFFLLMFPGQLWAQTERVVEIPTRPDVTQRMVVIEPEKPKAAVILFAGGHGGLQISSKGDFRWGEGNFLVRSRRLFSSEMRLNEAAKMGFSRVVLPASNAERLSVKFPLELLPVRHVKEALSRVAGK